MSFREFSLKIAVFCCTFFCFLSCTDKKTDTKPKKYFLTKVFSEGKLVKEFDYLNDTLAASLKTYRNDTLLREITYQYTGSDVTSLIQKDFGKVQNAWILISTTKKQFVRNADRQVIQEDGLTQRKDGSFGLTSRKVHRYDAGGKRIETDFLDAYESFNPQKPTNRFKYVYNTFGNMVETTWLTKANSYADLEKAGTDKFEYDNQKNIFAVGDFYLYIFPDFYNRNNVIKEIYTYTDFQEITEFNSVYEYNEDGYPTRLTRTRSDGKVRYSENYEYKILN
jgi:hypothetical protein